MKCYQVGIVVLALAIGYASYDWFDPAQVSGQRVVITGASIGIGEQMAYHYARLGANVVITARREHLLQKVIAHCREVGVADGQYHYVVADMSDMRSAQKVIQEAVRFLGGIDVLVLNHKHDSIVGQWTASGENLTNLEASMNINFYSYVHLASHAMAHLEESQGRLAIVSSIMGYTPGPFTAPYGASKHALEGFFSSLRLELAISGSGVSISTCPIGLTATGSALNVLKELKISKSMASLAAPTEDVALAIIKGTTLRQRDVIYPPFTGRLAPFLNFFLPRLSDALTKHVYTLESSEQQ